MSSSFGRPRQSDDGPVPLLVGETSDARNPSDLCYLPRLQEVAARHPHFLQLLVGEFSVTNSPAEWETSTNILLRWLTVAAGCEWGPELEVAISQGPLPTFSTGQQPSSSSSDSSSFVAASGRENSRPTIWLNPAIATAEFNQTNGHTPVAGVGHFALVVLHEIGHVLHNMPAGNYYFSDMWREIIKPACESASSSSVMLSLRDFNKWRRKLNDAAERMADVFAHQIAQCSTKNCRY